MVREEEDDTCLVPTLPFCGYYTGFNAPPLSLRAQCCVMMLYRVSGEGGGGWNMGVKSQSLASYINRIYLFIRARIRSDCSADKAEKVVYFYTKIRHFKNFEPNSFVSYLVFLTFQGIISLSPFIDRDDFANPKCWKSSCRDLRIIATFSNQPILNSRKERRKEREKRNSTGIVGRGTIGRANRGRKAPGSRELFAARLSGHREERRSRGKYGSRRWSIEQHTELVT